MKIKKIDEDVHIYDNQDTFDYIKGTITNVNELIDALNELEEKVNKLENEKEELKSELSWINYHQLGLDKKQSAPEHEDKAFLPLLKYNAAKFFNIDKYTNKTSKGYECKLCTDPVFISIDEMPMYQHLNDAHPFGKSDSKDCICGIVTDNAHRYDCPFFKEIDSQPTDDSDKIELKISINSNTDTFYIRTDQYNTRDKAEAIRERIEKALEFYEKCEQFQITKEYQLTDDLIQNEQCRAHHRVAREDAEDRNKYQPQEEKATIQANSTNSGNGLDSEESQPSESWKNEFIDNCIKDKYLVRPLSSPASIDRYVLLKDISRWIEDAKKSVFSKSDFETIRECLFNCRQATEEAYFDEHRSIIGKIESLLKDKGGQDVK